MVCRGDAGDAPKRPIAVRYEHIFADYDDGQCIVPRSIAPLYKTGARGIIELPIAGIAR